MTRSTVDPDRPLGDLVRESPEFARVFESLGIDYCCGGDQTLAAACEAEGLDVSDVCDRLADARGEGEGKRDPPEWETLSELIDHVVTTHHQFLREELSDLEELVVKVRRAHEENHPELRKVEQEFRALAAEMRDHTEAEESDVFPIVEKLDRGEDLTPAEAERLRGELASLEDDHEETAAHLEALADLTDDYAVPDDACPSYRSMLDRLEALERDTHRHVHEENNVLFREVEARLEAPQ